MPPSGSVLTSSSIQSSASAAGPLNIGGTSRRAYAGWSCDGVESRTMADSHAPRTRYRSIIADSSRWDGFAFRAGDVVISTPPKCGTTWTQMLCALLIFDGPAFPAPLGDISPWLDMNIRPLADVTAALAAQTHRRVIKTHTPLDGIPLHADVTYLVVG